ncbi:D-alanyl-D-alanine carboxypeptidase [Streptacidiphilus sp. PB12-B1b]|uniref:D-alanyl-D-alanine carboxypeptidase family protein n=1 Tax=Streptacidiphilus sp. PB12-B1b TaxID=2705012 RepID=UPI0015FB65CA|nr:D-alanyl-D-alanine carboxypeptidase [Streptacidiphilus sp. PB12-B1b]QMU79231.1 D-alanyl-D-alanine carboxypeptidase [Streptacidiphilus sp. PB12-B1b]
MAAPLCAAVVLGGPASAASAAAPASAKAAPRPPAVMSSVGGAQLALAGVRSEPLPGSPALPADLSALAWIVSDAGSGDVLAAKDAHWQLPPASTLKTLFADTVLPRIPASETHLVTAADLAGMGQGSSEVGVVPGQTYKVSDLWLGVFLRSGNDAVHVLAAMNGGVPATVTAMQAQARALGADDTHVVTPDGYDEPGQVSSAYDLSLFARAGLRNPQFAAYCATASAEFPGGPSTRNKPFEIDNTDRMLSGIDGVSRYPGLIGVKNGYTTNAGNTLVVAARRGGRTILVTVMNPQSGKFNAVYGEARELLDWGFAADGRVRPVGSLNPAPAAPSAAGAHRGRVPGSKRPGAGALTASDAGNAPGTLGWTAACGAAALAIATGAVLVVRRRRRTG